MQEFKRRKLAVAAIESVILDLEQKIRESVGSPTSNLQDLKGLKLALKFSDPDRFDAAKWSRGDIKSVCENLDIFCTSCFIDRCIEVLNSRFDANEGINWDSIKDAVLSVYEAEGGEK